MNNNAVNELILENSAPVKMWTNGVPVSYTHLTLPTILRV